MIDELLRTLFVLVFGTTVGKFIVLVFLFVMPLASVLTWMERRQSAYSQDRYGPRRAVVKIGRLHIRLWGLVHIAADGLKMFFKEPFVPRSADRAVFHIAPAVGFITALVTMALIPFGPDVTVGDEAVHMQIARLDSGILFALAIGSVGIYGAALAGWASNNRFALLGSLRASAQTISYEIALGLTIVGMLIVAGSSEFSQIVSAQSGTFAGGVLPTWGIFLQPLGAVLFFIAAMAETKRVPFDLPEGESEIIGYFLEYSSMGFGLFMLGEFIEVVVLASVFTTVFLGGWQLPWVIGASSVNLGFWVTDHPVVVGLVGALIFGLKTAFVCALQLQVRWSLPRFRYDQLMRLGWKNLLPLALANIFVTAVLVYLDPGLEALLAAGVCGILLFAGVVVAGPRRAAVAHS